MPERANRDRLPICLVGLLGDEPVAAATLKFREIEFADDADHWLGSVYVREDVRGRGYGRAIVGATADLAATRGFVPLYLYTRDKRGLCERLGWRVVGAPAVDGRPATVMALSPGRVNRNREAE